MDVVGAIASVSQLAAYSRSTAQCLQRLYISVRDGPAIYRSEKSNIRLLLEITAEVCGGNPEAHERILPILVDISKIACQIFNLLEHRSFSAFRWNSLITHRTLEQSFSALVVKRQLLHLHLGQSSNALLVEIRSEISAMSQKVSKSSLAQDSSRPVPTANGLSESRQDTGEENALIRHNGGCGVVACSKGANNGDETQNHSGTGDSYSQKVDNAAASGRVEVNENDLAWSVGIVGNGTTTPAAVLEVKKNKLTSSFFFAGNSGNTSTQIDTLVELQKQQLANRDRTQRDET